jgi:hypothetical protein
MKTQRYVKFFEAEAWEGLNWYEAVLDWAKNNKIEKIFSYEKWKKECLTKEFKLVEYSDSPFTCAYKRIPKKALLICGIGYMAGEFGIVLDPPLVLDPEIKITSRDSGYMLEDIWSELRK